LGLVVLEHVCNVISELSDSDALKQSTIEQFYARGVYMGAGM